MPLLSLGMDQSNDENVECHKRFDLLYCMRIGFQMKWSKLDLRISIKVKGWGRDYWGAIMQLLSLGIIHPNDGDIECYKRLNLPNAINKPMRYHDKIIVQ